MIIVNKMDLITAEQAVVLESLLHRLNPSARLINTTFAKLKKAQMKAILNSRSFDFEKAALAPGWLQTIRGQVLSHSVKNEYQINFLASSCAGCT